MYKCPRKTCDAIRADMIAEKLRELRTIAKINQVTIAEKLNLSQAHISRIEKGTPTTTDVLERWISLCDGIITIVHQSQKTNPLSTLPDSDRLLLEAAKPLCDEDRQRLTSMARALGRAEGMTRELLIGQVDTTVRTILKSSPSAEGE